ncbi:flagellar basal body rod protein FlgF [Candidatus Methylobacter oryzae]|uniref:Flagellar basal-body rod protein FlgF n=1 Tax=Candidatus Methylobacter oryzae TaxID=2497749 RepID=A0ABY3C9A2_9GAMM|nr:flagellar basal body rod protein FlgF [Candidatus Methylobacter oryzae]TRW93028.1 flagellar basal body rod protein FlgF [Candidatus Methylobacter oryzae]
MDRSLYIAMSGAKQTLQAQNSNANNLANMQTTGFKSDLDWFRSRPVTGAGYPTRVYAMIEKPAADFMPGAMQTTGRDLDVAINGEGWIAVQGGDYDSKEAYTRAGDLRITPEGLLKNGAGLQVLGQNGPITIPPAEKVTIGSDGTISIIPMGSGNATTTVQVDRIKLVKPDIKDIEKQGDGLIHTKNGQPLPADADVSLNSGVLEGSNVKGFEAMTEMIELAKNFELQTKVMKSVDENSAASAKLMQIG